MKFDYPRKVRSGYLAAFVLLLLSYALTISSFVQLREQHQWVLHTRVTIYRIESLLSSLKDAEIGVRGYSMFEDGQFLMPYYTSRTRADSVLGLLVADNSTSPIQRQRLDTLQGMIGREFALVNEQLNLIRDSTKGSDEALRDVSVRDNAVMDSIRFVTGLMQIREDELLDQRLRKVAVSGRVAYAITVASLLVSILLIVYALVSFNVENKAKRTARREADDYHGQLEKRVEELDRANAELVELRSLEKFTATGRLARMIAHEVRNPLTNIDLSAGHLENTGVAPEDRKMFLDIIARNSKRINQLITDLLQATKFTDLEYRKMNINDLLEETLQQAGDRARLAGVTIEKSFGAGIPDIQVDKERLKIGLLNIIVNALESMPPEKGVLKVRSERVNNTCLISIRDNGKGMNEETLARIFDPYFTSKANGNGLGLTNTQNIILSHKGKIRALSREGEGTEFIIHLNLAGTEGVS